MKKLEKIDEWSLRRILSKDFSSQLEMSERLGVSDTALSCVISFKRCVPKACIKIAQHINRDPHDIWPDWFDFSGNRINIKKS